MSCAAGLATLQVILEDDLSARAEELGHQVVEELAPIRSDPRVQEVRSLGSMVGVEFHRTAEGLAKRVVASALENDVLLLTCGQHDQVVRFIPALNIEFAALRAGVRCFVDAVGSSTV